MLEGLKMPLLNLKSILQVTQSLRNNEIDPIDYINELEDIYNQLEPEIRAFVPENRRFDRLRGEAEALKAKYPNTHKRPLLFCFPIGVKDIFHVDGFPTQAGSQLPSDRLVGKEAKSVAILKGLGALILGKTITTEFAYFAPGLTRNPHNLNHTPGGSSSGSAAAVASGLALFAFGTQTIGSVIRPASYCGVVGYKPTYERISKDGVLPLSPSVDTVGYFTTNVISARFMAQFLCTGWQSSQQMDRKPVFGIPYGPYLNEATTEMLDHFERTCSLINKAGYQIKEVKMMLDFAEIKHRHNLIVAVEAAQIHKNLYAEFSSLYHPKTIELIKRGKEVNFNDYQNALNGCVKFREELTTIMKIEGIDLWLSPPAKDSAPHGLESTGDPVMNLPWTHCGFPVINIPSGLNVNNLPIGLQVSAVWNRDESLLYWGIEIERLLSG